MSRSCDGKEHIVHILAKPEKTGLTLELKVKGCDGFLSATLQAIIDQFYKIDPDIVESAFESFLINNFKEIR